LWATASYSGGTPKVDQGGQFFKKFSKVCKMIMSNYNSSASGELSQMWCNHNKQTKPFDTNSEKRKKKTKKIPSKRCFHIVDIPVLAILTACMRTALQ